MTNSRIIRIMLWLPLLAGVAYFGWKLAYSFLYINVYLDIGGLAGDDLLRMTRPLFYYSLFLYWALPRVRGVEDADLLSSLAFRMVTAFAVIIMAPEMLIHMTWVGWQGLPSLWPALVMFVVFWFIGCAYMALISTVLGLRWLATMLTRPRGPSGMTPVI